MAIYINLGIACGFSRQVADSIESHFQGFTFAVAEIGGVECEVWRKQNLEHWFLGVWPRGLGYATSRYSRPELLPHEAQIRDVLYQRHSLVNGYRRAMFGGEAFDTLWFGTPDELTDIDYTGMSYADAEFRDAAGGQSVKPFAKGYSIILEASAEPSAAPNGGPATPQDNPRATDGPPSVS